MTATTPRRTEPLRLRQAISELLEEISAIEHSMELFHRKGDPTELERAAASFNNMLGQVDRLGEMLADARTRQPPAADGVRDKAALCSA
jgi:hypothetical protein